MIDQILLNQSDKIEVDIKYNNVLTAPASIIIKTLTDSNGVIRGTDLAVIAGATTGRYYYTVPAATANLLGIYTALWEFVISGTTYQHSQEFEIVSSIREGYVVPEEIRDKATYEKITTTDPSDAVLQRHIDKATPIIDAWLGDTINYAQYSEVIRCVLDTVRGGIHIQLRHRPIISVTSVTLTATPATTVDLDVDSIRINTRSGYLEYFYDVSWPSLKVCIIDPTASNIVPEATVVYTAGYSTIPDKVKMAAVMIVEELYKQTKGDRDTLQAYTLDKQKWVYKNSKAVEGALSKLGLENVVGALKLLRNYRQPMRGIGMWGPLG